MQMAPLTTLISGLSGSFDPEIDRPAEAASADDSGQSARETLQADDSGQPAGETLQADAENREASERLAALLQEIFKDVPEEYHAGDPGRKERSAGNCDCSRERIESALLTIGRRDHDRRSSRKMERRNCSVSSACKKYHFNKDELVAISWQCAWDQR